MEGPDENKDVLGSLPRRRPGIKSPRRAGERAAAEQRATAPPPASAPRRPDPEPGDLERLARAGIGIAGGTAAVGLKLAGRAIGGLGRAAGRR